MSFKFEILLEKTEVWTGPAEIYYEINVKFKSRIFFLLFAPEMLNFPLFIKNDNEI